MTPDSSSIDRKPILVLTANGKTGKRVADRLEARGYPVRRASRRGETRFDWNDASTWADALRGVQAAYVVYTPDLAVPEAPPAIKQFTQLAVELGVRRLVVLSGRGEVEAERCEQIVMDSGAEWTIVRASWFNQNFSEGAFTDMVRAGVVALPARDVPEPFVDVDDIADVAVASLTEPGHAGELYEVTGPRLLTLSQAVEAVAQAAGREVVFQRITTEQFTDALTQEGLPTSYIELLNYLMTEVLDGRNANLTDGVQRALGRAPRDFKDYASQVAATGVWGEAVHA